MYERLKDRLTHGALAVCIGYVYLLCLAQLSGVI